MMRVITRLRIAHQDSEQAWAAGTPHEVGYWEHYFATGGDQWPEDLKRRLDPVVPLQEHVGRYLPRGSARILDVGAGPLTSLGKTWPDTPVEIVAVDALADEYDRILSEEGITPPVRTTRCDAERLTERFGAEFD